MEIRELIIIIQEYFLEAYKVIKKILKEAINGLRILLRYIVKNLEKFDAWDDIKKIFKEAVDGLRILLRFIIKKLEKIPFNDFKKAIIKISLEFYKVIKKLSEMIVEGFLFIMKKILPEVTKKYIEPAVNKVIEIIGEGFFILMRDVNKATGKTLNKVTEKVRTIKKHPEHQFKYLEDLVKLNMIIVPIYLVTMIILFILWSLTNKLVNLSLETIYLIIPFLLILCIPFFSFYNLLKDEKFSITDLILNILFIFLILASLVIFLVKLIF